MIFGAGGLFFLVMIVREIGTQWKMSHWPTVSCTIESSSVGTADKGYAFTVRYAYEFNGHKYVGNTYQSRYQQSDKYDEVQKLVSVYPAGSKSTCYVNPTNPSDAALAVKNGWMWLLFLPIPLLFIAIGFGGLYSTWFQRPSQKPVSDAGKPLSDKGMKISGAKAAVLLFGIFLIVGTLVTALWAVPALHKTIASRGWPATPCTVISSRVQSHDSDDGTTYSVDILYSYKVNGREYRSARYDFIGGSSSGYDGKKKIVAEYRPKHTAQCYVDPSDPTYAVLHPGISWMAILPMLPIVFMLIGGGGLIGVYRANRKKLATENIWARKPLATKGATETKSAPIPLPTNPATLKPATTAGKNFLGLLCFAIVWNGFIAILLAPWKRGGAPFDLCSTLFSLPFVLVGIGLIVGVVYSGLSMFNPTAEIDLSPTAVSLGSNVTIRWRVRGRSDRLTRLSIRLEAQEEATYRRGTKTSTDRNVFLILNIADTTSAIAIARGDATVSIPRNTMHTFASANNKIVWQLKVRGEIPNWPDMNADYPIQVAPMEPREIPV